MTAQPALWCILRTAPANTVALVTALTDAGYSVWTPMETTTRDAIRLEKSSEAAPLPAGRGKVPFAVPMIKSIVFADYDRLADLIRLADAPALTYRVWDATERRMVVRGRPYFTVFRENDRCPAVRDAELEPLRRLERRRKPRGKVPSFKPGDRVKLMETGFAGMSGIVQSVKNKTEAVVSFGGFLQTCTFPMWVLLDDNPAVHVNSVANEPAEPSS